MTDEERPKTEQQLMQTPDPTAQPDMVKDWSTDFFPTSARPIFIGWTIVALGVLALCVTVYLLSEHPVDPKTAHTKKVIQDKLHPEDEEEE